MAAFNKVQLQLFAFTSAWMWQQRQLCGTLLLVIDGAIHMAALATAEAIVRAVWKNRTECEGWLSHSMQKKKKKKTGEHLYLCSPNAAASKPQL